MRIGVIVDDGELAVWQAEALRRLGPKVELVLYNCLNSRPERRRVRFGLYYLLNLTSIRNPLTRKVPVPPELNVAAHRPFESEWDGAWQRFPGALIDQIRSDAPDLLVKFGMGLLRVPGVAELGVPILSYHHGNPARFRGRPAGFYEMLGGEPVMGQVVQLLSNSLDAGKIVAAAETRVVPHSYRATLMQAYAASPLLLGSALRTALAGKGREPAERGSNYRLPGNGTVLRLVALIAARWLRRLGYGLFREKLWRVATVDVSATLNMVTQAMADRSGWRDVPTPSGYRFLADPFFHPGGGLLVEALDSRSARGRLLLIQGDQARVVSRRGGHFSYPSTLAADGRCFVIPEVSDWSPPLAYPLGGETLGDPIQLRLPGQPRLLDPTAMTDQGTVYLFANVAGEGSGVLRLWFADAIDQPFSEHPASPIRISPNGSRMGGGVARMDGELIRVGQDFRGAYGDGLSFFRIRRIDRETYEEEPCGEFRLSNVRGPHTLNLSDGRAVFDYYTDSVSALAGWRRYRERRAAGRIAE